MENIVKNNRIEWVDIFKAIAIICVVIGHSTGKLNMFIYQFHIAAFFFISGYSSGLGRRGLCETVWNKVCTLLLPLATVFFILLMLIAGLNQVGLFETFFKESYFGALFAIQQFFSKGLIYIPWLGAAWFINSLFIVYLLQRVIYRVCNDKTGAIYIIISLLVFIGGYKFCKTPLPFNIDVAMIGQFYFAIGFFFREKKIFEKFFSHQLINIALLLLTITGVIFFGKVCITTVDYPSRSFGNPFIDALAAVNGILFIYIISYYISKLHKNIKKPLILLAQNTIGIMFFHFLFYKLTTLFFYLFGKISLSGFQPLVPPTELSDKWWVIYSTVSLFASVGLWKLLCIPSFMKILLGLAKTSYNNAYNKIFRKSILAILIREKYPIVKEYFKNQLIKLKYYFKKYKLFCVTLIVLFVATTLPLLKNGIIINDELQRRFFAMGGFRTFSAAMWNISISIGRLLQFIPKPIAAYLPFALSSAQYIGIIKIGVIFINILLFGVLINRIFKNTKFAIFTVIMMLVTIPITFEPNVPNAYSDFSIAFSILILSFLFYIEYLEKKSKKPLIISSILLFFVLCCYEAFLMFTPIFLYLFLHYNNDKANLFKKMIVKLSAPFFTSVIYLFLYVILSNLFTNNYEGTQLAFVSISSTLKIIGQLVLSSIPGYFLFNPKYAYMYMLYCSSSAFSLDVKSILRMYVENIFTTRIFIIALSVALLLFLIFGKTPVSMINKKFSRRKIILASVCCVILPSIPNSFSKMYQGNVNSVSFPALPVSYFMQFAMVFLISFLIWILAERFRKKRGWLIISVCIIAFCLPIQSMNDVLSKEQEKNFKRLRTIESIFDTEVVVTLAQQRDVSASDLYQTKNALAIHDGYWTQYAQFKGIDTEIRNDSFQANLVNIYFQNDQFFVISIDDYRVVLSQKSLSTVQPVRINETEFLLVDFININNSRIDGDFYEYCFRLEHNQIKSIEYVPELFDEISIGNTLATSQKLFGYYDDGWVISESKFNLKGGSEGTLIVTGYYPGEIEQPLTGTIVISDERIERYIIEEALFTLSYDVPKNQNITIEFINDFYLPHDTIADQRDLCFILLDLVVE